MDMLSCDEFPSIDTTHNHHVFFQEELVFFYFYNYRPSSLEETTSLSIRFDHVLRTLKQSLYKDVFGSQEYLILFFRLLGYTRSIQHGKGEHDLSYLMLCSWYKQFPTLAIYALHRFVVCTYAQETPFGSWRDMKYLCQFINTYTVQKQDHALIDVCCDMMNNQLEKDLATQNIHALPKNIHSISNVAKWIPREHKKVDWLYDKLVIHWTKQHKPHILRTATGASYWSALNKCKRLYRKKIASLNKMIDTTQIKQCARLRHTIIPSHVSQFTQMKQPNLVFGHGDNDKKDRLLCSQHFRNWFDQKHIPSSGGPSTINSLPINSYIKRAVQLLANVDEINQDTIEYEKHILNKQWSVLSRTFHKNHIGHTIPIVDVSDSMCQTTLDHYYTAIGHAILLAQNSLFTNRILAVHDTPTWINLENKQGLVSAVEHIQHCLRNASCIYANFNSAFLLIGKTIRNSSLTNREIRNMRLVLFSTGSTLSSTPLMYDTIVSQFNDFCFHMPFIVFWNVSNEVGDKFPCSIHQHSAIMISGSSSSLFAILLDKFKYLHTTPYKTICNLLRHPRYDVLENYVLRNIVPR